MRAGIPECVAIKLTGHETHSVFKRYAIVDETMLVEQTEKLTELYQASAAKAERKVASLGR